MQALMASTTCGNGGGEVEVVYLAELHVAHAHTSAEDMYG